MSLLAEKTAPAASRPVPPVGRLEPLNLARRPFTNARPVTRAAVALWILGLLLLLGNVSLFWSYLSGSEAKRDDLARMEQQVGQEGQTVAQLEARLATMDLAQQNRKVRYLNRRSAERTFSWSLLFDRLSEAMPNDIRITRLTPQGVADKSDRADLEVTAPQRPGDERVTLSMSAEAKSDEVMSRFVNNLFAHPAFEEPDIPHESREENDILKFDVQVLYLPSGTPQRAVVIEEQPLLARPAAPAPAAPARPAGPGAEIE
jgi:hypothetical protein